MDSMTITVLESYDLKFCCVCTQNGGSFYLNIFENVISYRSVYVSLAQIMLETLGFNIPQNTGRLQEICNDCKKKMVDFFIFKRRNEEARKIFSESSGSGVPIKNMLLEVVDQIDNSLTEQEHEHCGDGDEVDQIMTDDETNEEFFEQVDAVVPDELSSRDDMSFEEQENSKEQTTEVPREYSDIPHEFDNDIEVEFLDEESKSDQGLNEVTDTPKKKSFRQANPESWMRNKRKLAKNTGQPYVASNGKFIEAKQMKTDCGSTCRRRCTTKVNLENRFRNFYHFYGLADIAKQRKFLFDHIKTSESKRNKVVKNPQKTRAVERSYFLDVTNDNEAQESVQVCKLMFLNTFSISSQMIDTLYRKAVSKGEFSDTRGKFDRERSKVKQFDLNRKSKQNEIESRVTEQESAQASLRILDDLTVTSNLGSRTSEIKNSSSTDKFNEKIVNSRVCRRKTTKNLRTEKNV